LSWAGFGSGHGSASFAVVEGLNEEDAVTVKVNVHPAATSTGAVKNTLNLLERHRAKQAGVCVISV
jgi:hypothetical protein